MITSEDATPIEPVFKEKGHYLGRCHQWVGEPAPPGYLPGWSAHTECWWVRLEGAGPYGGRWIIAGFDRDAVKAAAEEKVREKASGGHACGYTTGGVWVCCPGLCSEPVCQQEPMPAPPPAEDVTESEHDNDDHE